ncbi:MAG: GNAT family protein [Bacteroidota bacterium]
MNLSVREATASDIQNIVDYFWNSSPEFLLGMGAEKRKLPHRDTWIDKLQQELVKPYSKKEYYYIIWLLEGQPVGHSNVNAIRFGEQATMHLHIWNAHARKRGLGTGFLKLTIPSYFKNLQIQQLICEPFAENNAPNRTLVKLGFRFIQSYETVPGPINFLQKVNRYALERRNLEHFRKPLDGHDD